MQFARLTELVHTTPSAELCEAWGASPGYVSLVRARTSNMTVQEAGELAAIHGLTLPDILSV